MKHFSQSELDMMTRYRTAFLGTDIAPTEEILDRVYYKEKQTLYKLLNNQYKISVPFEYHKNKNIIHDEVRKKLLNTPNDFITQYRAWTYHYSHSMYEDTNKSTAVYIGLQDKINTNSLSTNKVDYVKYVTEIKCPDGTSFKVANGMKLMHYFSKIVNNFPESFSKVYFERFRIAHSMICNDKALRGTLTLSIHPLDFWTMSDNASNWSSCMSWSVMGEYRAGTIEMMNSPYVLMAYIESDEPFKITRQDEWNNKIWRELYIIDKNIITNVKSYPYYNSDITNYVLTWIRELAEKNLNWHYTDELETHYNDEIYLDTKNGEIKVDFKTQFMYNDMVDYEHTMFLALEPDDIEPCYDYVINYSG